MADGKVVIEIDGDASGFTDSLNDAGSSASRVGDIFKGSLKAELVAKGIELAAQAAAKLSGAMIDLGKKALAGFADYEQLVGGIETLFKGSAGVVEEYAANAFSTAGLSANEYMETVTSFSASLIQGLGGDTAEAARVANMAITDMSDNANKMGTDMSMLQNAYQGFARGNFAMLDNLKLGYGGTREEMVRLINDSGVLGEKIDSLDGVTFDTMLTAIHEVQTQMGITGTTAEEAATTIQGSLSAAKAAWDNLLVGMADGNADMDSLINNFVKAAETAMNNIVPVIGRIGEAIGPMLASLGEAIGAHSGELATAAVSIITGLIEGLKGAASGIAEALPSIIGALISALPGIAGDLLELGAGIVLGIINGIIAALGPVGDMLTSVFGPLLDGVKTALGPLGDSIFGEVDTAGRNAANRAGYWGGLIYGNFTGSGTAVKENAKQGASTLMSRVFNELDTAGQEAITKATGYNGQIYQAFLGTPSGTGGGGKTNGSGGGRADGGLKEAVVAEVESAGKAAVASAGGYSDEITAAFTGEGPGHGGQVGGGAGRQGDGMSARFVEIVETAAEEARDAAEEGGGWVSDDFVKSVASGVASKDDDVITASQALMHGATSAAEYAAKDAGTAGQLIPTNIASGAQNAANTLYSAVNGVMGQAKAEAAARAVEAQQAGQAFDSSTAGGISGNADSVNSAASSMVSGAVAAGRASTAGSDGIGRDIATGAAGGVREYARQLATAAASMVRQAMAAAKAAAGIHSPSTVFRDEVGKMIALGTAVGIEQGGVDVDRAIRGIVTSALATADAAMDGLADGVLAKLSWLTENITLGVTALGSAINNQIAVLNKLSDNQITGIDAEIAAIYAEQERRAEAKELQEHEERLAELRQKYAESEAKDKAKVQEEIDDLIADWNEKQLKKQEQAEIERLNAEKKALQEAAQAKEAALKEQLKAEEAAAAELIKIRESALNDYAQAWDDALKDLASDHATTMQDIANQQEAMADRLVGFGELTTVTNAGQYRLADLSKDTKAIKAYGEELLKLRDRGVNEELWNEILGMDQAEATKFARKLNKLNDEAYAAYMQSYADKQAAAEEVAEAIFGPVRDAAETDYLTGLPDAMAEIGESAMGALAEKIGDDEEVIAAARGVADEVIAEFDRITLGAKTQAMVLAAVLANNAALANISADAFNVREASAQEQATRQAVANNMAANAGASPERDVVLVVNGTEFARATINDYRAVESQSPQIRSD